MGEGQQVVVGLDNGGTTNNATVLDADGRFLVDHLVETPSRVAIFCHREAKWPVSNISTWSPGLSVFDSAASQAPVPEAG